MSLMINKLFISLSPVSQHRVYGELTTLRPTSDTQQVEQLYRATLWQLSIFHRKTIAEQTWLLVTQTTTKLSVVHKKLIATYQRRQVNVRKRKRNSLHVNKQLTNHSSATERDIAENRDDFYLAI